jgi:hypothetical protein
MMDLTLKSAIKVKPLENKMTKKGIDYVLIKRGLKSVVYEQRFSESLIYYVVFVIKIRPQRIFKNRIRESRERFPCNEAFGKWSWACWTFEEAQIKFNELESKK